MSKRRRRHLLLAAGSVLLLTVLYAVFGLSPERWLDIPDPKAESVIWRLSMALAYSALIFLGATLSLGPINLLRGRPLPVSAMLRRDVGIWAGGLALAHMALGMLIHSDGLKIWWLFIQHRPSWQHPLPLRLSKFGLANYLGLLQGTILLGLLLLSNNRMLRRLGPRRWKNLQRLVYLAFISIAAHGLLYQQVEQRDGRIITLFILLTAVILGMQLLGFWRYRRRQTSINMTGLRETIR
jgi:sulfoxide reductase heme-binding subunit YedZ